MCICVQMGPKNVYTRGILYMYYVFKFLASSIYIYTYIYIYISVVCACVFVCLFKCVLVYHYNPNVGLKAILIDPFLQVFHPNLHAIHIYILRATCFVQHFYLYSVNRKIFWAVQIMKLLIFQTLPVPF